VVTLSPHAQRASQACDYPCRTHCVDVPLHAAWGLDVDLQHAIDRLAVAIYDGTAS
jgi:hypothetical protein